jgi:predicted component of type VI protein secretion system
MHASRQASSSLGSDRSRLTVAVQGARRRRSPSQKWLQAASLTKSAATSSPRYSLYVMGAVHPLDVLVDLVLAG